MTADGKLYGPERYRDIVKERYLISKHLNTSYVDTGEITPVERDYLLKFINDDLEKQHNIIEEQRAKMKQK